MRSSPYAKHPKQQRGIVLVVVLAFLVMLTVIGLSLFGTTTIAEKMGRNYRDFDVASEAAEAALRDAEIRISGYWVYAANANATPKPVDPLAFTNTCTNGLCSQAAQPVYSTFLADCQSTTPANCQALGTITGSPTLPNVALQPRYLIESMQWLSPGSSLSDQSAYKLAYRITAIGFGQRRTTQVLLQEIFVPD